MREMVRRPWPPSKAIAGDDDLDDDEEEDYDDGDHLILNFDNSSRANSIIRQWVCGPQRHRHTRVGRCLCTLYCYKTTRDERPTEVRERIEVWPGRF